MTYGEERQEVVNGCPGQSGASVKETTVPAAASRPRVCGHGLSTGSMIARIRESQHMRTFMRMTMPGLVLKLSVVAGLFSGAFIVPSGPAEAGEWYKVRNPYHNTSRSACIRGVRISRWEMRRSWRGRSGGCWAYIASSQAEYNRYSSRGARQGRQQSLNRRCQQRYGRSFYWSASRKRCINYARGINQSRRAEQYRRIARRVCGAGNYVYSARGYRCISSRRPRAGAAPSCWRRCGTGGVYTRSGPQGCTARAGVCPRGFPNGPNRFGCCFDR